MRKMPVLRWFRKSLLVLVAAAVAFAALEGGHRLWLERRATPYSYDATIARLDALVDTARAYTATPTGDEARGRVTNWLHPYYGSENYPDTGRVLRSFEEGFPENAYVIVVVGGSVAAAFSQAPAAFLEHVESSGRLAGRDVRVLQYAHASYKQPQQVMRLAYLFSLGYRPDAVINLDGFNEVAAAYHHGMKGVHPVYPSGEIWSGLIRILRNPDGEALELYARLEALRSEAEAVVERARRWGVLRSSLLARWTLATLDGINARRAEVQGQLIALPNTAGHRDPQANGPDFDRSLPSVVDIAVENWFESSISLHALCRARGIPYLHCLQPTLLDPGSKIVSDVEATFGSDAAGWSEAVLAGYPRLREAGAELADRGVEFADLSRCFREVEETIYIDAVHFTPDGNQRLGSVVAAAFLEALDG